MLHSVKWFRKHLVVRLVATVMIVILALSAGYITMEFRNAKHAGMEAISSYGIRLSESYTKGMDAGKLEQFLKDPEENDLYWNIRQELDKYRTQIGALYVYVVRFDEQRKPLIMIDGQPKGSDVASPINEETDISEPEIESLLKGNSASSAIIDDPKYGKYISTYTPVKNAEGKVIAVLGIDTEAGVTEQISSSVMKSNLPVYGIMLVLTILGLGLVMLFVSRALHPLHWIGAGAQSIAKGDFLSARQLLAANPVRSVDEIGTVYNAMLKMSNDINDMLRTIVSNVSHTSDQFFETTQHFNAQAHRLLAMNTNVNASLQVVADGANTVQFSTNESARSMEEMATAIHRISEASLTVSDASDNALQSAQSGQTIVQNMNGQFVTITSTTSEALRRADLLRGHSKEIGIALSAISDISEQTKLLALNASIEAARAGEHGAGFAVVAGEVRKLADHAAESAKLIADLLQNIHNEIKRMGDAMEAGMSEIKTGAALSKKAEDFFRHIVEQFRYVSEQIQDISSVTEEMSAGSEEVAASVVDIAHIAKSSSDGTSNIHQLTHEQLKIAQEIADSADALSGLTHEMRKSIEQIKV
ncbi:methyl-accepting chemotaxis protein [Paenibacillus aceris]|uniref:Methyl-accepting chemotaxis protein n=1 Tax=Paenibacillus aceris TaxID=869555 RepID=A0ABS4HSL7_9BACL|nr:methyl-accepting chemotaxis protein [Paenibacillus aceris]MBP1961615.1 methyl-accepting chemotaxis protein [Paenibacillus aceris]NHW37612.1 methyl-accepting chemotaxis protein [Paenibacillus aceris]